MVGKPASSIMPPAPNPNPSPTTAHMNHVAEKRETFAGKTTDIVVTDEIPAVYCVENLREYEFPVVGVIVHPRIIPGFCYRYSNPLVLFALNIETLILITPY